MGYPTPIEWTDATWNPVGGCSPTSPGCTNCYAQRLAGTRLKHHPLYAGTTTPSKAGPVFNGTMTEAPDGADGWTWPLRWRGGNHPKLGAGRPSLIFVGDMADLFHMNRPRHVIAQVVAVAAVAQQHIFQFLTKRADVQRDLFLDPAFWDDVNCFVDELATEHTDVLARRRDDYRAIARDGAPDEPLPNVWLGVSVEDRQSLWRLDALRDTPAALRFVSFEPLLEDLGDLGQYLKADHYYCDEGSDADPTPAHRCLRRAVDWAIAGYESGPEARPRHPDIARSIRDQCVAADVPFFFKQWGEFAPDDAMRTWPKFPTPYWVWRDGRSVETDHADARGLLEHDPSATLMLRAGKKAAGALLDGREHREFPA